MKNLQKLKCIDALTLKILAMAFMLCDHLWATVLSGNALLTAIGRLAFPIFAFQMVESYFHTRSIKRLMQRLLIFALLSEIPFNLMTGGGIIYPFHQNVMFTFLIALGFVHFMERSRQSGKLWKYILSIALSLAGGFLLGMLCLVDYFGFGVLTVYLFYFCRNLRFGWPLQLVGLFIINAVFMGGQVPPVTIGSLYLELPQQGIAVFSLLLIWLYNGKRGKHSKAIQYSYYAFYPLHMLLLALLALYWSR